MNMNLITSHVSNPTSIPEYQNVNIDDIDQIANSICKAVRLDDVLRYLTTAQLEAVLSKIRHGGIIDIQSPDIVILSKGLYWGNIDLAKFSSLISPSITYHSAISIKGFLEQRGYLIEEVTVQTDMFIFNIKAKRQ